MKKIITVFFAIFVVVNMLVAGPQMVVMSYGSNSINIIDMETKQTLWQYVIPNKGDIKCNSVLVLEGGKYLAFTTQSSAQVIEIESKEIVWEYRPKMAKKTFEVHSLVPIEDGGFAVFNATMPVEVLEVSKEFKVTKTMRFEEFKGTTNPHAMFRLVSKASDGNYLMPWYADKCVYKVSREGKIVDKYDIGLDAFGVSEIGKSTILYGTGDDASIREFDVKKGKLITEIASFTKDGNKAWVQYVGQVEKLSKNRYLVTNWTGHFKQKQETKTDYYPVMFICNKKGEIEWDFTNDMALATKMTKGTSGFLICDEPIIKVQK